MKNKDSDTNATNYIRMPRILFGSVLIVIAFALAIPTFAQTQYNLIEPLPGIQNVKDFPDFISRFIPFLLAFAALAAFVQIVFGGILRATSGGNPTAIGDANNRIWMAIGGLVLALSGYLILNTINPDLVSLRFLVPKVEIKPSIPNTENPSQRRPGLNQQCSIGVGCESPYECSITTSPPTCKQSTVSEEKKPSLNQNCEPVIGCKTQTPAIICQQVGSGESAEFKCLERTPLFGTNHVCDPKTEPNGGCRSELKCKLNTSGFTKCQP